MLSILLLIADFKHSKITFLREIGEIQQIQNTVDVKSSLLVIYKLKLVNKSIKT